MLPNSTFNAGADKLDVAFMELNLSAQKFAKEHLREPDACNEQKCAWRAYCMWYEVENSFDKWKMILKPTSSMCPSHINENLWIEVKEQCMWCMCGILQS